MTRSPYKILIGPLWNLSNIGDAILDPNIQPFYMGEAGLRSNLPQRAGGSYFTFSPELSPPALRQVHQLRLADLFADLPAGWQPDLLIWMGLYFGLPVDLASCPVPSILVAGDWHLHYTQIRVLIEAFDFVLCDRSLLQILQKQGHRRCEYWPVYSFVPELVKEYPVPERDLDVSFIGNYTPAVYAERNRYLMRLARLGQEYRIFLGSQIYHPEYSRLLSRSKLVFNHTLRQEMNLRVYEAAACGALCLVEADNLEIRDFLVPGESCVLYDQQNFEDVVRHYLQHPQEAGAIARRGQERIQAFDCNRQFAMLLKRLPEILKIIQPRSVLQDHPLSAPASEPDHDPQHKFSRPFLSRPLIERELLRAAQMGTREVPELRAQAILLLEDLLGQVQTSQERLQVINALAVCHTDYQVQNQGRPAAEATFLFRYSCAQAQAMLEQAIQSEAPLEPLLIHNLLWIYGLSQRGTAIYPWLERQRQALAQAQSTSFDTYALFVLPLGYTQFYLKWQQLHARHEGDPVARNAALAQLLSWSCLFHYGQMAAGAGSPDLAVPAFEAAAELCGDVSDPWLELGRLYALLGQPDKAIERLWHAIDRGVYYPQAWMLLLQLLIAQNRLDQARDAFLLADVLFQSPRFAAVRQGLVQLKGKLPQSHW